MEILNQTSQQVTENVFILQHPTEGVLIYKEWLNDSGKLIDCELRSKSGYSIDDAALFDEVCEFVDNVS